MSKTTDRPYHHGDLRRAIIDTAMGMLHTDKGWQFTLREVARQAGVSHAAPYKHFADKAALLGEISLIGFDRLREILARSVSPKPASLRAGIFAMAESYMHFASANSGLYRLMFSTDSGSVPEVHLSDRALSALGVLVELLERGQAEGLLRIRDVRGQAAACWALMHGLALLSIDGLLLPEKVGSNVLENALTALLEGLEA
ncbi:TetR/AcrR family transcriptional regulator [Pseudomonas aeruginosa]|uniref:TetR/AcrR family transcriptional regulator n=1 Tax=Pseudomonas aeruginosa TaxID=287 RepID=UPI00053E5189|nr:TetR/AcrR family transcriptional regulator [Pseudomonas aeruginosa]MBX5936386.1 TetR/AcrR family transcriptional regulator [Pseudomonas aeruginosa]MCV3866940.1 TetR/AcrR family transcriptional regulator [Pseudomonas aeruginosa]MCV3929589.1 TetR/AcrR family transcriptional regulator [Pseudomonas aeruginosa]MEC6557787.1 TetR/AcrR family transcriptional regulator [Pseudomonas aeruginosa]HCH0551074.1 TetR/AcrR family transcriptional regulator [Pseudomonas aeruginosa]